MLQPILFKELMISGGGHNGMLDLNRLLKKGIFLKNCRMKGRVSGTHSLSNPRTSRIAEKPSLVYAREGSLSLTI